MPSTVEETSAVDLPLEVLSEPFPSQPISSLPAEGNDSDDDKPLSFKRTTRAATSRSRGTCQKKPPPKKKIKEQYLAVEQFLPKDLKDVWNVAKEQFRWNLYLLETLGGVHSRIGLE